MTDYEAAGPAAQQAGLRIAVAVGACVSAAVAPVGIRAMVGANKERAVILDPQRESDDKCHEEAMAAHAEAMAAGARRHEENMTALKARIAGLERRTTGLETVVERTASAKTGE